MRPVKKSIIVLVTIVAIPLCWYAYFKIVEWRLQHRGEAIAKKVEAFRHTHGRLPDSLEQVGIINEEKLYYQKRGKDTFMIFYGTSLGESEIYYSDDQKWENFAR